MPALEKAMHSKGFGLFGLSEGAVLESNSGTQDFGTFRLFGPGTPRIIIPSADHAASDFTI